VSSTARLERGRERESFEKPPSLILSGYRVTFPVGEIIRKIKLLRELEFQMAKAYVRCYQHDKTN